MARLAALFTIAGIVADASVMETIQPSNNTTGTPRPNFTEYQEAAAATESSAQAAAAKEKKLGAVNKLIQMLEDVRMKVVTEGEQEAYSYNEFACFCKDTIKEKQDSITSGSDEKETLESDISAFSADRDTLDAKIKKLLKDIDATNAEIKKEKEIRAQQSVVYNANSIDLKAALDALESAIASLKASKPEPSMLQVRDMAKTLRTAAILADTLGLMQDSSKSTLSVFLQQGPDVPMDNYKFHSGEIIATLERLQKDFRDKRDEIDAAEVSAVAEHDQTMQDKANFIKALNVDLEDAKATKAQKIKMIAETSQQLSVTAAQLLDDQQYLETLAGMCTDKRITWDSRSKARQDELSMLTQVLDVISSTVANKTTASTVRFAQKAVSLRIAKRLASSPAFMEAAELEAEGQESGKAISFFQQKRQSGMPSSTEKVGVIDQGREAVIEVLKSQGAKLKSQQLMALATEIAGMSAVGADPFAKVKQLIQDLIDRLLRQASNEVDQKAWCDKATSAAEQKRTYAVEKIEELNAQMAEYEALRDKLTEELSVLSSEIQDLKDNRQKAETMRNKEKAHNMETIEDAEQGEQAIQLAKDILDKFYRAAAKNEVNVSLAQQTPEQDAPDAGFDNFEAYTGAQGEASGILGMMEVLESDFQRTIANTKKAENEAQQEFLMFMTETGKSLVEKETAHDQRDQEKTAAVEELSQADDDLGTNTDVLRGAIKELLELKAACIDTGMSYADRKHLREEEIEALKKALCILENYEAYGPDGAASNC